MTEALAGAAAAAPPAVDSASGRRVFADLDALRASVGEHLGFSAWREVTQAQVDLFAEATGDHQWIHVDPEAAKAGPFGTTIAHGYLTLSLVPVVLEEVYEVGRLAMGVNYGCNKVRFPAPVPVGSRVRGGVELVAAEPFGDGVQVAMRVTIEREGGDRPVCVAETLAVLYPVLIAQAWSTSKNCWLAERCWLRRSAPPGSAR